MEVPPNSNGCDPCSVALRPCQFQCCSKPSFVCVVIHTVGGEYPTPVYCMVEGQYVKYDAFPEWRRGYGGGRKLQNHHEWHEAGLVLLGLADAQSLCFRIECPRSPVLNGKGWAKLSTAGGMQSPETFSKPRRAPLHSTLPAVPTCPMSLSFGHSGLWGSWCPYAPRDVPPGLSGSQEALAGSRWLDAGTVQRAPTLVAQDSPYQSINNNHPAPHPPARDLVYKMGQ